MNARTNTARGRAVENANRQIDESAQRARAARQQIDEPKKPRNALEMMAQNLQMSPVNLKNTLVDTVFRGCRNDSEFAALIVVANTYGLNPLLKEIYAFPAKGGGVVPMVGIDGWIKLMNSHPKFDGIEFLDLADDSGIYAIEATIWRTDKSRPTKIVEYLDECKRNTEPWNKSPLRMLRHRALMQCARIAFGFSGIAVGDDDAIEITPVVVDDALPKILPNEQTLGEQDSEPNTRGAPAPDDEQVNEETGEIIDQQDSLGMTQVDEETARALDAGDADDSQLGEGQDMVDEIDGPLDDDRTEQPLWVGQVADIRSRLAKAASLKAVSTIEADWTNRVMVGVGDDEVIRSVDRDIANKKREIKAKGE